MRDSEFRELVRRHPEVKPLFERVAGSYRNKPFWRLKSKEKLDRRFRSKAKLETNLVFAEVAYGSFGRKGFDQEGKPIVASNVAKAMRDKVFKKAKEPEWKRMLERIKREIVVEA